MRRPQPAVAMPPIPVHFALFDSKVGRCGVAWSSAGLVRIQLPEATDQETSQRLATEQATLARTPPPAVARAIERLTRHLQGDLQDLADLPLDFRCLGQFPRKVYEAARRVPAGRTTTYGELAKSIQAPNASRAVGQSLGKNPFPIVVPCHRILAANAKIGGFSAYGGVTTKTRLLEIEGVYLDSRAEPKGDAAGTRGLDSATAIEQLRRTDPKLRALIDQVGPLRLEIRKTQNSFAALSEAIVYQQLTGKAAATIFGRFKGLYPGQRFPSPARVLATPDSTLRQAGLSGNKISALKDLADKVASGVVPSVSVLRRMSNQDIIERLTAVRGVGRWTVEMLLIFRLARPDIFPTDDYGVRKGFARVFGTAQFPDRSAMTEYAERWRPYRSIVTWYLWRAVELPAQALI